MSTFFTVLFFCLGAFFFSYTLWKKLREDWANNEIFKFTLVIFMGFLLGWWAASLWFPSFSFWITILAPFLAGTYVHKKLGFRFFEVIDALVPAWFSFLFFSYSGVLIAHWIRFASIVAHVATVFVIAQLFAVIGSIVLYKYLLKRYRRFSWYPSGKVGFAGLASLAFYFLLRTIISIVAHFAAPTNIVSLPYFSLSVEIFNAIMGLGLMAFTVFVLYSRSGRKTNGKSNKKENKSS